jgi:hypothetical protein
MLLMGCSPHLGLASMLASVALLAACAGGPAVEVKPEHDVSEAVQIHSTGRVRRGFACCNLRYSGYLLSDENYAQLPFIAIGTTVLIREIDGGQAIVEINGKQMLLRPDIAQRKVTPAQWLDKAVLADDPRPKLENLPSGVRAAILSGRLAKGMTREQVIMAMGYPQANDKKGMDAPSWRYWWSSFVPYYVYWSGNKLSRIDGQGEVVGAVTYKDR